MRASPLLFIVFLAIVPAQAGSSFGGPGPRSGGGHGHFGAPHGAPRNFVNAVSDIEPGPAPPEPPALPPEPPAEPASVAPPEPVYLRDPYVAELAPPRRFRSSPRIVYLRAPVKRRAGPVVIYGSD